MNADVDSYNVDEVCRLCLKCEGTILPIFGLEHSSRDCIPLSNKIKACVAVEISRNDELPKKICVGCVHQVDSWHKFKTNCDTAQSKLITWLKTTESSKTTNEIIIKQEPFDEDDVICCDDDDDVDDVAYSSTHSPLLESGSVSKTALTSNAFRKGFDNNNEGINVGDNSHSSIKASVNDSTRINDSEVSDYQPTERTSLNDDDDDDHDHDSNVSIVDDDDNDPVDFEDMDVGSASLSTSNTVLNNGEVQRVQDEETDLVTQSDKGKDQSMLKKALEGEMLNGVQTLSSNNVSIEMMMADFSDELATDVELMNVVNNQADDSDDDIQNGADETAVDTLKNESSTIIDMIHSEISRRLSADYEIGIPISGDDDDGVDYDAIMDDDDNDVPSISNNSDIEIIGRTTRRSRRLDEKFPVSSAMPESNLVIEAFTLTNDYHDADGKSFAQDPFGEAHDTMIHVNGTIHSSSSNPDLETLTVLSNMTYDDLPAIKQEPQSPDPTDDVLFDLTSVKKEPLDWGTEAAATVDVKSDADQIDMKNKKRGRIPCEPCHSSYPDYVHWLRHTKSNKHRRNVRNYERGDTAPPPVTPTPPPPTPPPPLPPTNTVNLPPSVTDFNGVQYHTCPIMSCSRTFKHRRNLQSHVKQNHGFNLKDLERSEAQPKQIEAYPTEKIPREPKIRNEDPGKSPREPKVNNQAPGSLPFSCTHCSKQFGYRRSLQHHMFIFHNVSPPTPRLKCPRCMKNFQRVTGLKSHLRTCGIFHQSKRCPFCEQVFPTYKDNKIHRAVCKKRYAAKQKDLPTPKVVMPEHGTYSCRFCDITYQARSIYTDHMEMYHPGEPFDVAPAPEESNSTPEAINQSEKLLPVETLSNEEHTKDFTGEESNGEMPCEFCTKTFPSIEVLNAHVNEHQYNRSFECKLCHRILTTLRYFQDHMRSHFIQHRGQYLCWTCYKPFNNRSDLNAHKKLHLTMKIFTCNICKHSFHNFTALQRHKIIHVTGLESEANSIPDAPKRTPVIKKEIYKETTRKKSDNPDYQCNICKRIFSNKYTLDRHSQLHKPVNSEVIKKFSHTCLSCNKSFKSRFELRSHMPFCKLSLQPSTDTQDGEHSSALTQSYKKAVLNKIALPHRRVQCDKCGTSFSNAIGLKKHTSMNRCPLVQHDFDKTHKVFPCRYCRKSLSTVVGLYKHLNSCKVFINKYGKNYNSKKCPTCNKQFSSLGVLYNHGRFCSANATNVVKQEPGVPVAGKSVCKNCNVEFYNHESYQEHLKSCKKSVEATVSKRIIKKTCAYCDKTFDSSISYKLHKKYCPRENRTSSNPTGSYRCEGCSRVFFSEDRLKVHLKACKFYRQTPVVMLTKQAIIEQCKCGSVFSSRSSLEAHMTSCSIVNEPSSVSSENNNSGTSTTSYLECEYCHRRFEKYQSRNSHLRVCKAKFDALYRPTARKENGQQRQPKPSPSPVSSTASSLSVTSSPSVPTTPVSVSSSLPPPPPMIPLSSLSSTSSPSFICSMCNSLFLTESDLVAHNCQKNANMSDSVEIMVEPDNPLNFTDYSDFGFHYMDDISSRENVLKCVPCDKVFSSSVTLTKHRNLFHPNDSEDVYLVKSDGSVQCPKCPRSFKDQKSMAHHMGWHTRHEDTSMQQQVSITTNYLPGPTSSTSPPAPFNPYVDQKTPFTCTFCNRSFYGKGQLQNHLKTHSQQSPYPSSSNSSGDVPKPATTLTYRCRFCSKRFRDKAVMLEHQNLHKTILAAASSTTSSGASVKPKPAAEPLPKYLVSCNMCRKVLSSNSVAKHKKMHELKQNISLSISTLFTPINKPLSKSKQIQQQQQQQQYSQQQYRQQQPPQEQTMLPCPVCFRLFSSQHSLTDHMATDHAAYSKVDVVEIDDDDNSGYSPHIDQGHTGQTMEEYKCEICNLSWQHKDEYLHHVNAASHRELTQRLSAILNRVNNDLVHS